MTIADDIVQVIDLKVKDAQQVVTWAGTIQSISPVLVLLDGQQAPIPCLATDFVSLVENRRCVVQRVGQDLVITNTYGGAQLTTLTATNATVTNLTTSPTTGISAVGSGSFTNTSGYAALATVAASVVFTAPINGKVRIFLNGRLVNTSNVATAFYISTEVRTGGTVGAGSVVLGPSNGRAIGTSVGASATIFEAGRADTLTGLTPGTTYNVQAMVICTSGSANDADQVTVEVSPVP